MTEDKLRSIKDRIAKLLAKAEKTDNAHEAESFMAKVNELLELHEIELFEIRAHSGIDNDPMGEQLGEFNVYASMTWAKIVIHLAAKYYGAKVVWEDKRKNHLPYRVFGRESARVTAELMVPYVVSQVRQQARAYKADHPRTYDRKPMTDSIAQREIGLALSSRLQRMLSAAEARRADLQSRALVPVDMTESFAKDFYKGGTKQGRVSKKGYSHNASDYADKISLNRQTATDKRKQVGHG